MTDKKIEERAIPLNDDAALDTLIADAYKQMGPSEDALARMRAAVLEQASAPKTPIVPVWRKKRPIWQWAAPIAACLVLVAIGVGVLSTPQGEDSLVSLDQSGATTANSTAHPAAKGETEAYMAAEENSMLMPAPPVPYEGFDTEEYDSIEEAGFVSTKAKPLSTVSADVDTASYCNLRRMLREGLAADQIPTGAVRIEEMLNYFPYNYAGPSGDDLFGTTVRIGECPWNPQTKLAVFGFSTAPEATPATEGSNLVFLIDVSGSMDEPDKLELLQDSFATLLEGLGPNDKVSIVTYSGQEEVVLEGASGESKQEILRAIYRLRADGSTNGEAGLKMAYDVAERNKIEGGVNRIIMASDGDLNVGMTSESDLHDFVEKKRESGIYLSVLGFGSGNYKDNKMETLADNGNGQYHYIDCIAEAERVFKDKLTANLVPLANDVKIQLEFNPVQVKAYRLIGYENRALADQDFTNEARDAGEVGPGQQFTVAYELVLADSDFEVAEPELKYGQDSGGSVGSNEWLTCSMRFKKASTGEVASQQSTVDASSLAADPGDDWRFAASVIEFGMVLRDSKYAGESNLGTAADLARAAHAEGERSELLELIEAAGRTAARE